MSTTANEVLPASWNEQIARLRLGVEPVDALGGPGPLGGLGLHVENVPLPAALPIGAQPGAFGTFDDGIGLPGVRSNPSGRFSLAFGRSLVDAPTSRLIVRIVDPRRRFVPRRLSIPAPSFQTVIDAEEAHATDPTDPLAPRICRPALYPGANAGSAAGATIVRGRVTWDGDGTIVPWTRVMARTATAIDIHDEDGEVIDTVQPVLGRAHGDERGEFILYVGSLPRELAMAKIRTVDIELVVSARPVPAPNAPVASPTGSRLDPLWHLPVELVSSLDPDDGVTTGVTLPAGYTSSTTVALTCHRGRATVPQVSVVLP